MKRLLSIPLALLILFIPILRVHADDVLLEETSEVEVTADAVTTRDLNLYTNVVNVVNTDLTESEISHIFENFNDTTADLLLDNPEATSIDMSEALAASVCNADTCKGVDSYKEHKTLDSVVQNDISISGSSGDNALKNPASGVGISTGDVNAVVNVLNIVNSKLQNSHWTIVAVNIYGDWQGNLVLPPSSYFETAAMATPSTAATDEHVVFENTINVESSSGLNALAATGSPSLGLGEVTDSHIESGDAAALSSVKNIANTSLGQGTSYLGVINTVGGWQGEVFGLPSGVTAHQSDQGITFYSSSLGSNENLPGDEASESTLIKNTIDVSAQTGGNGIAGLNLDHNSIATGSSNALANVLNFGNIIAHDSNLTINIVNVMGKWHGDIFFGQPTLQTVADIAPPTEKTLLTLSYPSDDTSKKQLFYVLGGTAYVYTDIVSLRKTNDVPEVGIAAGKNIAFEVVVDNNSLIDLQNAIVYDILTDAEGTVVYRQNFPLDTLSAHQEATIAYAMDIPSDVAPGRYTNSAYLEGYLSEGNQFVRSAQVAKSSFTILLPEIVPTPTPTVSPVPEVLSQTTIDSNTEPKIVRSVIKPKEKKIVGPIRMVEAQSMLIPPSTGKSVVGMELDSLLRLTFLLLIIATCYVVAKTRQQHKQNII